jgi:hypothetical protein
MALAIQPLWKPILCSLNCIPAPANTTRRTPLPTRVLVQWPTSISGRPCLCMRIY